MNISERDTRDMIDAGFSVVLRDGSGDAAEPVTVQGWMVRDGKGTGVAVFGPYSAAVRATGVRVLYKDAFDDKEFGSPLALPAGQTYRYTLTVS